MAAESMISPILFILMSFWPILVAKWECYKDCCSGGSRFQELGGRWNVTKCDPDPCQFEMNVFQVICISQKHHKRSPNRPSSWKLMEPATRCRCQKACRFGNSLNQSEVSWRRCHRRCVEMLSWAEWICPKTNKGSPWKRYGWFFPSFLEAIFVNCTSKVRNPHPFRSTDIAEETITSKTTV